ncbi:Ig-like domain-containing protein [Photobacterium atrarenae]|uniref:Ig-like domain-containing protein n=1 Tax=Photobacterium atrarenae TaxID=865757 RepID=A0ABY5GMI7_9GAMM|nr:Ig-like domain-containing protein [Photobacterium atrarenae]UTV30381.1 Ig-like domain-containing protein [Photobacterium atrarenae]
MADTSVSIYAGKTLLATGKTDTHGKYAVEALIPVDQYGKIEKQPITYRAQRDDIVLYQYGGASLAEALKNNENHALITNFSTVEYVLADVDKNNFVSSTEWDAYQKRDRNVIEQNVIRYGVGLKAIIDYSATLAGFENSTVWLRALLSDSAWEEWYRLNTISYQDAWTALFNDEWFLEQEGDRFVDISQWDEKYDTIVTTEPTDAVIENIILGGIPQKVSIGDKLSPAVFALWSDVTSTDVSNLVQFVVHPEGALVVNGDSLEVKMAGPIVLQANYQGASAEIQMVAEVAETALDNIVLTGIHQQVTVGDKLQPLVSALWSDDTSTEVTSLATFTATPKKAVVVNNGQLQVVKPGNITLTAEYQGATATVQFNADQAVLASLRLDFDNRQQYLSDEFQVTAYGVHQNDYLVDFSNEATWVSSHPELLESLGNGRFLAKGTGMATVTATLGDLTATQEFDVVAKLIRFSLNLPNNSISRAETLQMSLNGEFNDGSVSVITDGIIWTSSNPDVLTIDENGVATGIIEGTSVVTATYQGNTLEETVTVIQPKIIASTPGFVDGVLTMNEGDIFEYGFKFSRSNGVEHVFTAVDNGLDFESYGFRAEVDASGIKVAEVDKDGERIRAVRAGETKLSIDNVPVELQQIFAEIGAISSTDVYDYPTKVTLPVNVVDNANVYQWNAFTGNAPAEGTSTLIQAIQSDNTLYRFWEVKGAEQDGIYLTQLTTAGETEPVLVLAATQDEHNIAHKFVSNEIIHASNGYVLLLTDSGNGAASDQQIVHRYQLSDGSTTEVVLTDFPNGKFNVTYDSFAFTPTGDLVVSHSDEAVTLHLYHFETGTWEQKASIPGVRVQTPANNTQIAVLDTQNMNNSGSFSAPVLSIFDLETQQITTQEFVVPGDAEHFCRSVETLSLAVEDALQDSGAGCMVSQKGSWDGIGYWIWDSIAELPKLHLFTDGKVQSTDDTFATAARKLDGHVLFSAGRIKDGEGNAVHEVAEIVDVEIDGIIEERVHHQRFAKQGEDLKGQYSAKTRLHDGTQFVVNNADVPNEVFAVLNHGVAVRDKDGQWSSDKYMYQLPVKIDTQWKLYNLGDTLVLSQEGNTDAKYWLLQMRKPPVEENPEVPVDPTPAQ